MDSGESFLCHEPDRVNEDGERNACVGWPQAVMKEAEVGYYESLPPWKKDLFERMAELTTEFENAVLAGKEFDVEAAMRNAVAEILMVYSCPKENNHADYTRPLFNLTDEGWQGPRFPD